MGPHGPATMWVAPPDCTTTDFQVNALPFQYNASSGQPPCACCPLESISCCQICHDWFCPAHGLNGNDVCLSCAPEPFLEDRLAGSSAMDATATRMFIERRRFSGDAPAFRRLCDRIEDVEEHVCIACAGSTCTTEQLHQQMEDTAIQRLNRAIDSLEDTVFLYDEHQLAKHPRTE